MEYLLLIYQDEEEAAARSAHERSGILERCLEHARQLARAGIFLGGAPLKFSWEAKTVRIRDGRTVVTEGPFAPLTPALGGYYRLRCDNRQQAIEQAADILRRQSNHQGAVEIHALHG